MTIPGSGRPSPASMPRRRRPVIPPAPAPRPSSRYKVAEEIPRRGWLDASLWLDTGVLLFIGTDEELPPRVRGHYRGRLRISKVIDAEVRWNSNKRPDDDAPAEDHQRVAAADVAVREFLLGGQRVPVQSLQEDDLDMIEPLKRKLAALSDDPGKKHGGEAELILLASRSAAQSGRRQVLLTNDGGASVVAAQQGIPARHAADLLTELACADGDLGSDRCWEMFQNGHPVSKLPGHCRPRGPGAFTCGRTGEGCPACDGKA